MNKYTLYGSPASLYTGKARAYLTYKNIPYQETLSSMKVYKKTIIPKTGVAMIPVVATPEGQYLQDTSIIIDTLEQQFPEKSVYPTAPTQRLVALLFELYGDEWMRLPAMHYRWNFPEDNLEFIKNEFGSSVAPNMPGFVQRWLGKKVVAKFSAYVEPLGITSATIPAIEQWYETLLDQLNEHFSKHDFLLGSRPCIGDFGLMGPLYAHLYRDPYPGKLMKSRAPNVAAWVERMNNSADIEGEFVSDDEIPASLHPILSHMFANYWPVLDKTQQALAEWAQEKPAGTSVPRTLGMHDFTLGDAQGEQMTLSFTQWMLQRSVDCYQSLNDDEKRTVDGFLAGLQAEGKMDIDIGRRVCVKNYKLELES